MSYAKFEHILADALEAEIPDWVYDQVTCAGCGACVPRDEAEPVGREKFCSTCAPEARHYEALNRRSDGEER